tara:strand:+ start:21863 stop:22051 length:189 start_codon:yes stop_codon:yes gene_type:complete
MVENVASTLNALIQPCSSMALFVDWDGKRLSTAIIYSVDKSNVEFLGMLRQVVSTGHSCSTH